MAVTAWEKRREYGRNPAFSLGVMLDPKYHKFWPHAPMGTLNEAEETLKKLVDPDEYEVAKCQLSHLHNNCRLLGLKEDSFEGILAVVSDLTHVVAWVGTKFAADCTPGSMKHKCHHVVKACLPSQSTIPSSPSRKLYIATAIQKCQVHKHLQSYIASVLQCLHGIASCE